MLMSTSMHPHVTRPKEHSLPPPPAPPPLSKQLAFFPPIPADSIAESPTDNAVPVKRKPLAATASPQLRAFSISYGGGRERGQTLESVSSAGLTQSFVAEQHQHWPTEPPFHNGTPVLRIQESLVTDSTHTTSPVRRKKAPIPLPPQQGVVRSFPNGGTEVLITPVDMAMSTGTRPPPLRMDSAASNKSAADAKKPQTPGNKFTSFFSRKQTASPSTESSVTDISDQSRSPLPSPYPPSPNTSSYAIGAPPTGGNSVKSSSPQQSLSSIAFDPSAPHRVGQDDLVSKCALLESELREISMELAGSIRREMDLEDLVERLQEGPSAGNTADRTSDYFSDSGTSSVRPPGSDVSARDGIDKIKREAEQQRAQMRTELSQRWQDEASSRKTLESHIQLLETKLQQSRRETNENSDMSARARELETALEDARRRLAEERLIKENFEDLLTALRVDLEQHRNQRDNLRDEVVPKLRSQIEGLESGLSESQKQSYDIARMQQEIQSLRDENAALTHARKLERDMQYGVEGQDLLNPARQSMIQAKGLGGLQRSSTMYLGRGNRASRSGSLSRSNSSATRPPTDSPQALSDQLKAIELQRDALHSTVKYLLRRQDHQQKQLEKRLKFAEAEGERAAMFKSPKKSGYEKDVRGLRSEINLLRKRADEALEQKWQCEKGLGGLKMDLDRSKQETAGLQKLLQAHDQTELERALAELQQQREQARSKDLLGSIAVEAKLAGQLEQSAERSEALATQVRQQLHANSSLRNRLKEAIETGERNQQASAAQISELQIKLRKLEDLITSAQTQSETAVMQHEDGIRVMRASHNIQLMRTQPGAKTPGLLSPAPRSPLSPLVTNSRRSPRLDRTSSGPGVPLQHALKTEFLENKVAELEKALADAEKEMGQVVGRMNTAQIGVAELQAERDEALRKSRKLEAAVQAERQKMQALLKR